MKQGASLDSNELGRLRRGDVVRVRPDEKKEARGDGKLAAWARTAGTLVNSRLGRIYNLARAPFIDPDASHLTRRSIPRILVEREPCFKAHDTTTAAAPSAAARCGKTRPA